MNQNKIIFNIKFSKITLFIIVDYVAAITAKNRY